MKEEKHIKILRQQLELLTELQKQVDDPQIIIELSDKIIVLSDALTNLEESQNNKLSIWKDASLINQLALSIQNKCAKDACGVHQKILIIDLFAREYHYLSLLLAIGAFF